jgi:hypothetical protein
MPDPLLSPAFLFRFTVPCRSLAKAPATGCVALSESHALMSFGQFEGQPRYAELRAAWHAQGLAFDLQVTGKRQSLWCRQNRLDDSDGLHLWIDTRDAHNIHRASRFCHHFVFIPVGAEKGALQPTGALLPINRARENPRPVDPSALHVRSQTQRGSYRLQLLLPAATLTGYDPQEQPRLGFFYAVSDRELGWQTFSVGTEFPFQEDPSLWGTLELVASQ